MKCCTRLSGCHSQLCSLQCSISFVFWLNRSPARSLALDRKGLPTTSASTVPASSRVFTNRLNRDWSCLVPLKLLCSSPYVLLSSDIRWKSAVTLSHEHSRLREAGVLRHSVKVACICGVRATSESLGARPK